MIKRLTLLLLVSGFALGHSYPVVVPECLGWESAVLVPPEYTESAAHPYRFTRSDGAEVFIGDLLFLDLLECGLKVEFMDGSKVWKPFRHDTKNFSKQGKSWAWRLM